MNYKEAKASLEGYLQAHGKYLDKEHLDMLEACLNALDASIKTVYRITTTDIDMVLVQEEITLTPEQREKLISRISDKDFSCDYDDIKIAADYILDD